MQEESWRERSEILRLGLSEMMDERNDLRQIILSLEKWRRDGRISAAEYAELKAKYGKRLADADRLIEELKEITKEASQRSKRVWLKEIRWNIVAGSILRVTNVSKNFGAAVALRNVSFDLERGKILGLVGDNGGSKTHIPLRGNTRST